LSRATIEVIGAIGALLFGAVGILTGILALRSARKANFASDRSNEISADANVIAESALSESLEANRIVRESREIAKRLTDYQIASGEAAKSAQLIPKVGAIQHSRDGVIFTVNIRNDGPAAARNLIVQVLLNEEHRHSHTARDLPVTGPYTNGVGFQFPARTQTFRSAFPDDKYCAISRCASFSG